MAEDREDNVRHLHIVPEAMTRRVRKRKAGPPEGTDWVEWFQEKHFMEFAGWVESLDQATTEDEAREAIAQIRYLIRRWPR